MTDKPCTCDPEYRHRCIMCAGRGFVPDKPSPAPLPASLLAEKDAEIADLKERIAELELALSEFEGVHQNCASRTSKPRSD